MIYVLSGKVCRCVLIGYMSDNRLMYVSYDLSIRRRYHFCEWRDGPLGRTVVISDI